MDDVYCVAEDLEVMPLSTRKDEAVLALAEQHREVIVFYADWEDVVSFGGKNG